MALGYKKNFFKHYKKLTNRQYKIFKIYNKRTLITTRWKSGSNKIQWFRNWVVGLLKAAFFKSNWK